VIAGWRIFKARFAANPFDGEGARRTGGRWNSPGVKVVYLSESVAVATLEILVHVQDPSLLATYLLYRAEFEASLIEIVDSTSLPADWASFPAPPETQAVGDEWIASRRSAVLKVPSVVVFGRGFNYLVNPEHPDFKHIVIGSPEPCPFDARIVSALNKP
jgi:RES domain-containing protein